MQGLNWFTVFSYAQFLEGKRLVFLKARPWLDNGQELGSKVTTQIIEDKTQYGKPNMTNFGEQLTVKVRNLPPFWGRRGSSPGTGPTWPSASTTRSIISGISPFCWTAGGWGIVFI